MKNLSARFLLALFVAGFCAEQWSANAQINEYWDPFGTNASPGSGGSGTWSTATNWWASGSADSTWTNNNIAVFDGTPGTVTLGAAETANGLTFNVSNYTISGSSTLTLAGTPSITLPAGTNTISCAVASTVPVTVTGSGMLALTHSGGNSGLTGGVTVNNGTTVAITSTVGLGTGTITDSGTVDITVGAGSFIAPITGSGTWNVFIPYSSGSENIRYVVSSLSSFSGTMNLLAGLSSGAPGAGQIIISNATASGAITWNIGSGATLLLQPGNAAIAGVTFNASQVILNGPGNSQPFGALRADCCILNANVLLNGSGATIGNDGTPAAPTYLPGTISDGGNHYGFTNVAVGINRPLALQGANTYTGPTTLGGNGEAGCVLLGSGETPGTSGPLGASPYYNPGSIAFNGGTLIYSNVNNYDYSGRFSTNASQNYLINVNGQSVTFASPLASSGGALTLSDTAGGGVLTLSATNTYSGATTLNAGTLNISGKLTGTVLTANGGGLQLDRPDGLPSGTILTLPASPASGMVNLNFAGTQTITTLNFGGTAQPSGTYGSLTNNSVQYQNAGFVGPGVLNVQPPTYWDPAYSQTSPGSGGDGNWDSTSTNWLIGSSDTHWVSNNVANFSGAAGTVTLNANETADGLTFNTGGYVINGGSALTLGGTPIVTVSGSAEVDCSLAGSGGLTESGSGTLTLGGSNTFTGALTISLFDGLVLNGANAFQGATSIGVGGSLTIGNSGNLGNGAYAGAIGIANSATFTYNSSANQALSGIMSGPGALDQEGPGSLSTSGLNTFSGGITINNGTLTVNGAGDLGNNPTFNTGSYAGGISDNGAFIYNSSAQQTLSGQISGSGALVQSGSGILTLSGQSTYGGSTTIGPGSELLISVSGGLGSGDYESSITNNGLFVFSGSSAQLLGGPISGSGALTQEGAGTLTLNGTNDYAGATTISADSTLALGATGSISNTASISIAASATLDVSALPTFMLGGGTSLSASGTALTSAFINGPSAGTVGFGAQPVSLTFTPQIFTGDYAHPALNVVQGALALGGNSIRVRNSGASPLGAGSYTLIEVASGTASGGATLNGAVSGAGLAAHTVATLAVTNGALNLVVSAPVSPPVINSLSFNGGNLIFSGTNGTSSGTYYVLASTNVALPLVQWTPVATNSFSPTGTFSATNAVGTIPSRFFIIEIPGH